MELNSELILNKLEQISEALNNHGEILRTMTAKMDSTHQTQHSPSVDASRSSAEPILRGGNSAHSETNLTLIPTLATNSADMHSFPAMPTSDESRNVAEFRLRSAIGSTQASAGGLSTQSLDFTNTSQGSDPEEFGRNQWRVEIYEDGLPAIVHVADESVKFQDHRLRKLLELLGFDGFWIGIIVLNALAMGAQLHIYAVRGVYHQEIMVYTDLVFSGLFVLEYFLRLVSKGMSNFFCGSSKYWAAYDTLILLISIIDTVLFSTGVWSSTSLSIRITRLVRILRLADVLRGIRFLRNLRLLLVGVIDSLLAITWTVVILAGVMYVGSVIVMTTVIEKVTIGEEYYVKKWGGVHTSMCTLFQVMTGDAWWTEVVAGIRDDYPHMQYMFMAYYSCTTLGLLNIVTAIFVENALSAASKDVELLRDKREKAAETLKIFFGDLFNIIDKNGNGEVNYEEFELCLRSPKIAFAMAQSDLKVDDVLKLFLLLDTSSTGVLRHDDFVKGCMMLRGQPTIADIFEHGVNSKRMLKAVLEKVNLCNMTLSKIMDDEDL